MECKKKLTIEAMHALAESKGGKCLSKEYLGAKTHLLWECECGHQWEATPESVKRGLWCPTDGGKYLYPQLRRRMLLLKSGIHNCLIK